jgi:hypothetical protein
MAVRPYARFVPKIDLCPYVPALFPNGRILLLQPTAHSFRILFRGTE